MYITNSYSIETDEGFIMSPNEKTMEYKLNKNRSYKWTFGNSHVVYNIGQDREFFINMCKKLESEDIKFTIIRDTYVEIEESSRMSFDEFTNISTGNHTKTE